MKIERPMLYSTDMILAKLAGRKSQTRRIVKPRSAEMTALLINLHVGVDIDRCKQELIRVHCPYGIVGDALYARETWDYAHDECGNPTGDSFGKYLYKANGDGNHGRWRPSIHMPKEAARIWDRITDIRVERLQDISPGDAVEEGIEYDNVDAEMLEGGELVADFKNYLWRDDPNYEDYYFPTYASCIDSYRSLWESINGPGSWEENHFVWVIVTENLSTTGRPKTL